MKGDQLVATAIDSSLSANIDLLGHGAASDGLLRQTTAQSVLGKILMLMLIPTWRHREDLAW